MPLGYFFMANWKKIVVVALVLIVVAPFVLLHANPTHRNLLAIRPRLITSEIPIIMIHGAKDLLVPQGMWTSSSAAFPMAIWRRLLRHLVICAFCFALAQRGHKHRLKDRDDGDHDQQFDQCEAAPRFERSPLERNDPGMRAFHHALAWTRTLSMFCPHSQI